MFKLFVRAVLLGGALALTGCLEFGPNLTGVAGSGSADDPFVLPAENETGIEQGIEDYLDHDGYWKFNYGSIPVLASGGTLANFGDVIYDTRTDTWLVVVDGDGYTLTNNAGVYESPDCSGVGTCVDLFIFDNDPSASQYGTFGLFSEDDGTNISVASIYYGLKTPADDMPTTGTATYNGQFAGGVGLIDGTVAEISSTAAIDVDFGVGSVALSSSGASFTLSALGTISGNTYSGSSVTASYTSGTTTNFTTDGELIGEFYGPSAEETGGAVKAASSDGDLFYGAFWGVK